MTGQQMLMLALGLLNYTDPTGMVNQGRVSDIYSRGLDVINQVYVDLALAEGKCFTETGSSSEKIERLTSLSQTICLSDRVVNDVMPYGVASMIALQEEDGLNQSYYSSVFNEKRRSVTAGRKVEDRWNYGA